MADELKDQRIPIMMSPSEVKAIDDWMFANRIKSRAQAIRRLCQLGLGADANIGQLSNDFSELMKSFDRLMKLNANSVEGEYTFEKYVRLLAETMADNQLKAAKMARPLNELAAAANIYKNFQSIDEDHIDVYSNVKAMFDDIIHELKTKQG